MEYYITVEPGVKVFVEDLNPTSKKVILFIHGWPLTHNAYEYQFNYFAEKGYRCIGYDTRGFGDSDKPASEYSYDRLSDDVKAVVDALKLDNFTLCGHSMGGATAIRYMARHRGYGVSRLALFGAAAPSVTKGANFPYGLPKEAVTQLINKSYNDRPKMLINNVVDMFFFQYITEPFSEWFFNLGLKAAGWSTAKCAETFRDETLFSDLDKIQIPTLILHGIHDKICRFPLAIAMNKGIKNSKLVPFKYSGHGLFYEQRDELNKELEDFIQ